MRRELWIPTAVVLLATLAVGATSSTVRADESNWPPCFQNCAQCGTDPEDCCPPWRPCWYARSEAILLRRDVAGSIPLATLGAGADVRLSTATMDEPFSAGPKLTIGHTFGDSPYQIEFTYFSLMETDTTLALRDTHVVPLAGGATGNLYSPFSGFGNPNAIAGFDRNNFVGVQETSDLQSGEMNFIRAMPMPRGLLATSVMIGLRYVAVNETFSYRSTSALPGGGSALTLDTVANNALWGPQIGALFEVYAQRQWWVNFTIKGAICNNFAQQSTFGTLNVDGVVDGIAQERNGNSTAYVADFDLSAVCRLTPHLTTRIGYQAVWIDGLALGVRNLTAPDAATLLGGPAWLDNRGTTVYHGPHAGVELTW